MTASLPRRLLSEVLGTALLLATVVGSATMGARLSGGNEAIALLANTLATGCALVALIFTFSGLSGAHFNPVVTVVDAARGGTAWRDVLPYGLAQLAGAVGGVVVAHMMFGQEALSISAHPREGLALVFGELIATFGLIVVIFLSAKNRPEAVPFVVGAYISAGYWFTSSSSFANPAATVARMLTPSPAGIAPLSAGGFLLGELLGTVAALATLSWLSPVGRK